MELIVYFSHRGLNNLTVDEVSTEFHKNNRRITYFILYILNFEVIILQQFK